MSKPKSGQGEGDLHKALTHPIRVRILSAMERTGTSSPVRFANSTKGTDHEADLNVVAYHFRVLDRMEVIECAGTRPRRGATEHIYRINPRSPVPDMLRATQLLQRISGISGEEDPNALDEIPVAILPVEVDQQGQRELQQLMETMKSNLMELSEECRRRLAESHAESISMRVGLAAFRPDVDDAPPVTI